MYNGHIITKERKMQNVIYCITKVEKDKNANTAVLNQIHVNEILDLVRRECNILKGESISIDRLEVLDDIIQTFNYELRGE
jgi:hypothetical protein